MGVVERDLCLAALWAYKHQVETEEKQTDETMSSQERYRKARKLKSAPSSSGLSE